MISAAVGRGGETMISAQTIEAFWNAVEHVKPLSVGLNCSLGPDLMYPFLAELSEKSRRGHLLLPERRPAQSALADRASISSPADMARYLGDFARRRPHQHRRRLLRQHARAHRGHRQGARGQASARPLQRRARRSHRPCEHDRRSRFSRCASPARSPSRSSPASSS